MLNMVESFKVFADNLLVFLVGNASSKILKSYSIEKHDYQS